MTSVEKLSVLIRNGYSIAFDDYYRVFWPMFSENNEFHFWDDPAQISDSEDSLDLHDFVNLDYVIEVMYRSLCKGGEQHA